MAAADGNGTSRMSVSEDTLRRVLAEFKLELFQDLRSYATQVAVDSLGAAMHAAVDGLGIRVGAVENQLAAMSGSDAKGRQVSAKTLAWAAVVATLVGSVAAVLLFHNG